MSHDSPKSAAAESYPTFWDAPAAAVNHRPAPAADAYVEFVNVIEEPHAHRAAAAANS
jgi:hypothetical protein